MDVQKGLVDYLPPARSCAFVPTIRGLIDRARAQGVPVVYVQHEEDGEGLVRGTPMWEIAGAIAPLPDDPIVAKRHRDAFRETDLADVLTRLGADRLVVCGMQTEFCIDATIREAERRGYAVTLVGDGHATYDDGALTEEQIRGHVNRVAGGVVATIVPATDLFV
ncbi:MAG: cysteine hydrolase family protein [Vulcanimicrobiaceae bacterium]